MSSSGTGTTPPFPFRGVLYALAIEAAIALIVFTALRGRYLLAGVLTAAAALELYTQSSALDRTSRQMHTVEGADERTL